MLPIKSRSLESGALWVVWDCWGDAAGELVALFGAQIDRFQGRRSGQVNRIRNIQAIGINLHLLLFLNGGDFFDN